MSMQSDWYRGTFPNTGALDCNGSSPYSQRVEPRLASAALALLAVATAACSHDGTEATSHRGFGGGPLAPPPGRTSIGLPVPINMPFSDGLLVAKNNGDKLAILDRASFVRPDSGLKYLGAYVVSRPLRCQKVRRIPAPRVCLFYTWKDKRRRVHTSRRSAVGFIGGFRLPRDGHAVKGFKVAPGAEVVVVLGIAVTRPGRHRFEALALDYHVGHSPFRDIYPSSGQLCAPRQRYVDKCHALLDRQTSAAFK